jgi:hypothetical protein
MTRNIVVHGLQRVLDKLGPDLIDKPLRDFFERISVTVQGEARQGAPVDRGHLRNAIQYEIDRDRPPLWARVGLVNARPGSPLWHKGRAMEYGTGRVGDREVSHKSGHWPPGPELEIWARRHGFDSGYQVAEIIGRRGGLKAHRFLRNAVDKSMGSIKRSLNRLGDDIAKRWG